ncbi:glycosyltransferase family 2 protein [Pseudomonadota bacterium]
MNLLILMLTLICGFLICYHHVAYPWLLKKISMRYKVAPPPVSQRSYQAAAADHDLPTVTIIMPAYNEAKFIAEKIRNIAHLDYPHEKIEVRLECDGCTDNTANIARKVLQEAECCDLNMEVVEHPINLGKLAVLNAAVSQCHSEIVVLSDVSALLPFDALLVVMTQFRQGDVGAVSGGYRMLTPGSEGEATYWNYQAAIKQRESAMGSVLGSHGAFYAFRRELFKPLERDIINDDFMLPMGIASAGWRVVYEPRACSLELEQASSNTDQQRRRRIAAGNMQQLIKLLHLINPKYGWLSFNFVSGKGLRAVMPYLLVAFLVGSLLLAPSFKLFLLLSAAQLAVYGTVMFMHLLGYQPKNKLIKVMDYLVYGYWAGLIGATRYLLGMSRGQWQRVAE